MLVPLAGDNLQGVAVEGAAGTKAHVVLIQTKIIARTYVNVLILLPIVDALHKLAMVKMNEMKGVDTLASNLKSQR
jgi:fumarate reductase subunit D